MDQKRKKILYLITKSNWGGAQKYVFDLATGISKDHFEVVVALGGDGELKKKLEDVGIRVLPIKNLGRNISLWKDIFVLKEIINIIKKEHPQIIHINSSKIGGLGSFAGRILKVPLIIFTSHGWAWNEDRPMWQKKIIKELQWFTIFLSHKTIVVSDALMRQVSDFHGVTKKIIRIYSGVREPVFYSKEEARKLLHALNNKLDLSSICIGIVAELHKNKGHIHSLSAIKSLKDQGLLDKLQIQYLIVGEGEERSNLEKLTAELGLENEVIFFGKIDQASMYLKAFDLFLLTSNTEALGYVLVEAGLAKIPIIGSLVGGIPEVVDDMKSGILVHRKNTKEVASAIQYIIERKEKQKEFSDSLYKKVKNIFSIEKMISDTEKVYSSEP